MSDIDLEIAAAQIALGAQAAQLYNITLIEKLLPKLPLFLGAKERKMYAYSDDMHELVDKTITAVWLGDDHDRLVFETDHGPVAYFVDGDCCSHSWFNDILGVDCLLGGTVTATESISMNEAESSHAYDVLQDYGIKITTDKGYADIVYRNSSNGYYGGSCHVDDCAHINLHMIRISGDWSRD